MKVAVVIPTYNRGARIAAGIESVLEQGDALSELIVVDDGSTDDTEARVAPYLGRLRYIRTPNQERGAARNTGARAASAELVTFVDSDDRIARGHLADAIDALGRAPRAGASYSDVIVEDDEGREIRRAAGARVPGWQGGAPVTTLIAEYSNCMLCQGATVYRRDALLALGGFHEDRRLAGSEDFELNVRMLARHGYVNTGKPTFLYRVHGANTFDNVAQSERCIRRSVELVAGNVDLAAYAALFPRMRASAELQLAAVHLGGGDMRGVWRSLFAAARQDPSVIVSSTFAKLTARSVAGRRFNKLLREMRKRMRRTQLQ